MEPFLKTKRCGPRRFSSAKTISPPTMVISWLCPHQWPQRLTATMAACESIPSLCTLVDWGQGENRVWQQDKVAGKRDCALAPEKRSIPDHEWIKAMTLIQAPTSAYGKFEGCIQLFNIWCFILIEIWADGWPRIRSMSTDLSKSPF